MSEPTLTDRIHAVLRENGGEVRFSQLYRELAFEFLATEIKAELDGMSGIECSYVPAALRGPSTLVIRSKGEK